MTDSVDGGDHRRPAALEAPVLGVWLLRRAGFELALERVRDALGLVFLAALASTTVSATVGTIGLIASHASTAASFGSTWVTWWLGDAMGNLVVAPLLLAWASVPVGIPAGRRLAEAALLVTLIAALGAMIHAGTVPADHIAPLAFLAFPLITWAGLRFGPRGTTLAVMGATGIVVWGAVDGHGPFLSDSLQWSLFYTHGFTSALAITGLLLASSISERRRAEAERGRVQQRLEDALTRVLADFLPICSYCKDVRTEADEWLPVENFIGSHTATQFSHSICPRCMETHHPEEADRL